MSYVIYSEEKIKNLNKKVKYLARYSVLLKTLFQTKFLFYTYPIPPTSGFLIFSSGIKMEN